MSHIFTNFRMRLALGVNCPMLLTWPWYCWPPPLPSDSVPPSSLGINGRNPPRLYLKSLTTNLLQIPDQMSTSAWNQFPQYQTGESSIKTKATIRQHKLTMYISLPTRLFEFRNGSSLKRV